MFKNGERDEKSRSPLTSLFRRRRENSNPAKQRLDELSFPSDPPPEYAQDTQAAYIPPPVPPPSASHDVTDVQPPGYAPWMAIPDNSLLPPPPSMPHRASPTANATFDSLLEARKWCNSNPLARPRHLSPSDRQRLERHDIALWPPPPSFHGHIHRSPSGAFKVQTQPTCDDTLLTTDLPLYSPISDNPSLTNLPQTIYFELKLLRTGTPSSPSSGRPPGSEATAGIALGFLAPPYPHYRLPGWERASLAIHSDDGRKYVHNSLGGQDFTSPFVDGEVVGVGMSFRSSSTSGGGGGRLDVEVFFTREGVLVGAWDLHEERDLHDEGSVSGLEGENELVGAIGMFGAVEFETRFRRDEWLYRPPL